MESSKRKIQLQLWPGRCTMKSEIAARTKWQRFGVRGWGSLPGEAVRAAAESGECTMRDRKLAVFFPGSKYGTQAPLFYYANLVLAEKGYEVIEISYEDLVSNSSDWINETRAQIWDRLKKIDFPVYREVVFVSKSIGTLIAGWISQQMERSVKNVFLTPLRGAFQYMAKEDSIVIAGELDRLLAAEELAAFCREKEIVLRQFAGAGHAIVNRKDPVKSAEILCDIVKLYESFIPQ